MFSKFYRTLTRTKREQRFSKTRLDESFLGFYLGVIGTAWRGTASDGDSQMFTAKKLFKAQFLAIRAEVRAMSDAKLFDYDSECYNFSLPPQYYRFIRKEIMRRFPGIGSLDALIANPSDLVGWVPSEEQAEEQAEENALREILEKALAG